jgi:hypothetical protein
MYNPNIPSKPQLNGLADADTVQSSPLPVPPSQLNLAVREIDFGLIVAVLGLCKGVFMP